MSPRAASLAALVAAAALASCGGPARGGAVVVPTGPRIVFATEVPAGGGPAAVAAAPRWPAGSRVVRRDLGLEAEPLVVSTDLVAAGGVDVSWNGERVLFRAAEAEGGPYSLWACDRDGGARRRLVPAGPGAIASAAWLPDGRVVYAAQVGAEGPVPEVAGAWALFVAEGDGKAGRRITWTAGLDLDPAVLADGRIVFASWLPGAERMALLAVHTDGTGVQVLHGAEEGPAVKRHPRPGPDGTLLYEGGPSWTATTAWQVDLGDPFREPAPVAADPLLERARVRATPDGYEVAEVVDAAPHRRPQGHLSMVRDEMRRGQVLCIDARPEGEAAVRVRVRVAQGTWTPAGAPPLHLLGEAALAEDGSFFLDVPADVPLLLEVLDADGAVLGATRSPFWVRPGETRGCIGCHEPRDSAPPNVRPRAVLAPAVALRGDGEGGGS